LWLLCVVGLRCGLWRVAAAPPAPVAATYR